MFYDFTVCVLNSVCPHGVINDVRHCRTEITFFDC